MDVVFHRQIALSAVALCAWGCNSATGSPATSATPAGGTCDVAATGPLIGYSYAVPPPAAASGGEIVDGVYDLTQIISHGEATGTWSSNNAPAFRWTMRITTEERSSNHVQGRLMSLFDLPPASRCIPGRFATFENQLRTVGDDDPKLNATPYSATPQGLTLVVVDVSFVFRRRM